jgi:hypothetical protein
MELRNSSFGIYLQEELWTSSLSGTCQVRRETGYNLEAVVGQNLLNKFWI